MPKRWKKLLFARNPRAYPGGDPIGYAKGLGCDAIALFARVTDAIWYRRAKQNFRAVYAYRHPNARLSEANQEMEIATVEGIDGYIWDAEGAAGGYWSLQNAVAAKQLIQERKRSGLDMWWSSFPHFSKREIFAQSGASGLVQVYDVRSGVDRFGPQNRNRWLKQWEDLHRGSAYPAVAMWARSAPGRQKDYLSSFPPVRRAALWHADPPTPPRGAQYGATAAWDPSQGLGVLGVILLATLIAGIGIFIWLGKS